MCFSQRNTKNIGQFSRKIFQKGLLSFLLYLHHIPKTSVFSSSKNFSFPAVWTGAYFSTFTPMSFQNCNPSKSISYRFIKTFLFFQPCVNICLFRKNPKLLLTRDKPFYGWFYLKAKHNKHPPSSTASFPMSPLISWSTETWQLGHGTASCPVPVKSGKVFPNERECSGALWSLGFLLLRLSAAASLISCNYGHSELPHCLIRPSAANADERSRWVTAGAGTLSV